MGYNYGDSSIDSFWAGELVYGGGGSDDALPVIVKTFKRVRFKRVFLDIFAEFMKAKAVTKAVLHR